MPAYGYIDAALEGLLVTGEDFIDSALAQDVAGIGFGKPAFVLEDDASGVYSANGAGRHLLGVTIRTAKEYAGSGQYFKGDAVGVVRVGKVWVTAGAAVLANQPAYLDATTLAWTNVATSNVATPYYFRTSASAGGLVLLDVTKGSAALGA